MVVLGFLVTSLPLPFVWTWPSNAADLLLFAGLGILGGIGHYCMIRAFEIAPAPTVAPFLYLQILTAAVLSVMIFGEASDIYVWAGSAIIILSGIVVLVHEQRGGSTRLVELTAQSLDTE
jgi:drug/metabolite transporter (DMT)-like permease